MLFLKVLLWTLKSEILILLTIDRPSPQGEGKGMRSTSVQL